jgi:hypothetical protein
MILIACGPGSLIDGQCLNRKGTLKRFASEAMSEGGRHVGFEKSANVFTKTENAIGQTRS